MKTFIIKLTSDFNGSDGTWSPVKRFNMHERISYRGENPVYHILNLIPSYFNSPTQQQRQEKHEISCLEKGIRPFGYPDHLWNEYLSDVRNEEHTALCEAKNEFLYQH